MHARGPDAHGEWVGEGVVLGHRRLSIVDLDSRANQPMESANGRYQIVFNGEVYNFRELRRELEADGVDFRTTSDTEVLLVLFARDAERMLPRLRGMFAFAIWDTETRELFLARDPYGIKPLYYAQTKDGLIFASQVKALVASRIVSTEREPAGIAGFFLWGSVPEPWTTFRGILALPAGHWLRTRSGVSTPPVPWHDIGTHWRTEGRTASKAQVQELVRQAVIDSVRAHLVADVPISVFLSGGIDSGAIAGLAAQLGAQTEGITVGFDEFAGLRDDETSAASATAKRYGLRHHVRTVSRAEFEQDIPRILDAMDQPSIDGVNTWFASKAVAERGYKVVLSGVGGDELFCGYSSFRQVPRLALFGRTIGAIPGASALLRAPCAAWSRYWSQPKLAALPDLAGSLEGAYFLRRGLFLPEELPALMGASMARQGLATLLGNPPGIANAHARNAVASVSLLESTLYLRNQLLRDSDWASMAHSLELRTPLVDAQLLSTLGPYVGNFRRGISKAMLAEAPTTPLPEIVASRRKTGFSVPMASWLSKWTDHRSWSEQPLLAPPRTSWARRWAKVVVDGVATCV